MLFGDCLRSAARASFVAAVCAPWLCPWPAGATVALTAADVERIVEQTVAKAERVRLPATVAVVDHEGNILGLFAMSAAREDVTTRGLSKARSEKVFALRQGIEGITFASRVPEAGTLHVASRCEGGQPTAPADLVLTGAALAAVSKAGTAAFFSTQGNAFTPRTAAFIIQPHFPPGIKDTSGGPLFGVQFSSLFGCSDVNSRLPLGLSGDAGGLPLYKHGRAVGGVGVEGDGIYTLDFDPRDTDVTTEEIIATAATRGFPAPRQIRADQILVGGLRFPFANTRETPGGPPPAGFLSGKGSFLIGPSDAPPSRFHKVKLAGLPGTVDPCFYPPTASTDPPAGGGGLSPDEVLRILAHGAARANRLRAAIRRPLGDRARVNITVVDRRGNILGIFRTADAPVFGFDVSAQKARSAAFFSSSAAAGTLATLGNQAVQHFVTAAARVGLGLDGRIAYADRSIAFLARPFFPDGIDDTSPGPLSRPISTWSIFNDGLQVELVRPYVWSLISGDPPAPPFPPPADARPLPTCTGLSELANGLQIFAGSVPLYRGSTLVGAVGVSGDGIDQDDAVAASASAGFGAPRDMRADRVFVRGVRLPYSKLPRQPEDR